jgi:O-antigen/teichoic acid export membrane protein
MLNGFVAAVGQKRAILGEFSWVIVGQAASVLGAIVGVRLLTEWLPPRVYGELALATTGGMLVNYILLGPLAHAYSRFYAPAAEAEELGPYFNSVARITVLVGIVLTCFSLLAVVGFVSLGYGTWISLLVATIVFAIAFGCNSIMDEIQSAARHRSVVALHHGISSWLRFLCAVWLVWTFGINSSVAMWGYCLGSLLVVTSQAFFFERRIIRPAKNLESPSTGEVRPWRSRMFQYAWPYSLWGVLVWLQMSSDRWALQVFGNTEEVGLYAVVYQLGFYPLMLLSGILTQLAGPVFFQLAGDGTLQWRKAQVSHRNRLLTIAALFVSLSCVAAAAVLHTWLFNLLTAEEYRSVSWLLPAVALSGGLFGTAEVSSLGLISNHGTRLLLKPKICSAILGIILNVLGAAGWGIAGVAAAGILANASYLLWMILLSMHEGTISPPRDAPSAVPNPIPGKGVGESQVS